MTALEGGAKATSSCLLGLLRCRRGRLLLITGFAWAGIAVASVAGAQAATPEGGLAWVEVTPLDGQGRGRLLDATAGEALSLPSELQERPVMICSGGEGWGVHCLQVVVEDDRSLVPEPRQGVRVSGRVLVGREPAVGARVAVAPARLSARRPFLLPLFRDRQGALRRHVMAGAEGRFEIPELAPGEYRLEISLPGGRVELTDAFAVPEPGVLRATLEAEARDRPLVFDRGEVALDAGLAVEFWVWAPDGTPLAGAVVGGLQQQEEGVLLFEGKTDGAGRAVLEGFVEGELRASCVTRGYRRYRRVFPQPPQRVDCWMEALATLRGRVVSDAEPVAGATVSLPAASRQARSDADGRFLFQDLEAAVYRLTVAAPGFRAAELEAEVAAGEERELPAVSLVPAPEVVGRLVDAESREPVPGAELVSLQPPGAVEAHGDEEGRFRFAAEGLDGLTLRVSAPGYPAQVAQVPPGAGAEDEELVIPLEKGGRVRSFVWDEETDRPCGGCFVALLRPGDGWQPPFGLRTSAQGVATSGDLLPGLYHVTLEQVRSQGSVVQVESGDDTQVVAVRRGETAEVYFGPWGSPLRVRVWPPPPPGWRLRLDGASTHATVDLAADGSALVRRRPGERLDLRLVGAGVSVHQGTLTADAGETTVELRLPSTLVVGRLTGAGGGGAEVRLRSLDGSAQGAWAVTAGGAFSVPFLPPGGYALEAEGRLLATVVLADGDELDLGEIPLPPENAAPPR